MMPLAMDRRCLTWLCICPADEFTSRWQKFGYIVFATIATLGSFGAFVSSLAYCWKYISIDLGKTLFSFMFVVAEFTAIYVALVGMLLMRHQIGPIFDNLTKIYKAQQNTDSFHFLASVNRTSEWMWSILLKITAVAIIGNLTVSPLMSILFNWLLYKSLKVENLYHPVPFLLPWNQTSALGYIGELCYSMPIGLGYFSVNGGFLLLFISICQHHQAFYQIFEHSLSKLNRPKHDKDNRHDAQVFYNVIRFHITIKEWFFQTAEVYNSFIAIQLICNEMILAISIFYLDFKFQKFGVDIDITIGITELFLGITNLLMYCYLGKLANESYAQMPDCMFYMNWYEMPAESQKYFILMIGNMQRALYYRGFGVLVLNLETFTKLLRSALSFYMAIKAVTSK